MINKTKKAIFKTALIKTTLIKSSKLFFLSSILAMLSTSCAISSTKTTSININGQLLTKRGQRKVGERVELVLPAEYGLEQVDIDHGNPEELARRAKSAIAKTDSLGTFNHTFKDVSYNTSFWILPPLGNLLSEPPNPKFLMRVLSRPEATYSLSIDENELTYGVWRSDKNKRKYSKPPFSFEGRLIKDSRLGNNDSPISSWIADLRGVENY